jgi:hypothetical protein
LFHHADVFSFEALAGWGNSSGKGWSATIQREYFDK